MIINGKEFSIREASLENANDDIERIVVHGVKFHADDVFCVAMASLCFPNAEIVRTNTVPEEYKSDAKTIVADIGGGKYDHHQADAEKRENGERYAACGLLFRDLKNMLFRGVEDYCENFETLFIIPIERADNGGENNPLSEAVSSFNPGWDTDKDYDEAFAEAVDFARGIILREIRRAISEGTAKRIVQEAFDKSDGDIVELPMYLPWRRYLVPTTARFAVYPSYRGGYNLQVVPASLDSKKAKQDLPEAWLEHKPEGCTFVHPALFIASFESKEDAMEAARAL